MKTKTENKILDFLAAWSPWLAPAIPAYFAAYNAYYYLVKGHTWFDVGAVVVIALVVETVGLVAAHTLIQFLTWNKTRNKTDAEAPTRLVFASVIVYVAIVILVNGLLDFANVAWPAALPYVKVVVVALLSLLSLNSALTVTLRAAHNERIAVKQKAKAERKERKVSEKKPETSGMAKRDWRNLSEQERQDVAGMTTAQIEVAFQVSDRVARLWKERSL